MRHEDIERKYSHTVFVDREIFKVGDQAAYEWEQDLTAMKWALQRMGEFLRIKKETGRTFVPGDNAIESGYRELLNRITKYSCPNMMKSGEDCQLKDYCTFPDCRHENITT